ncbi:transglutaminase family protein [Loktanella sp. IMCC34160]|uniref:transglutaminase family protein n=1 Tax=Loktanella sp. IMCC34160 TaxID=2510646 RepID=UPI00101DE4B2|nr:transglutaminase family protein [Loktanella sp. IMCC34160]RYG91716.1 transglutaminase family protein [Loktanella sp. IMCC34160]
MRLTIHHTTRYRFAEPVTFALQQVRKTPKSTAQQTVVDWQTNVQGGRKELSFEDHHNNTVELVSMDRGVVELDIVSDGTVDLTETHGVVGPHRGPAPLWLYLRSTDRTEAGPGVRDLLRGMDADQPLPALHELSERIRDRIAYEIGASESSWGAEEAIAAGRGVCQDHAHAFLACARRLGIPARYVSGYLMLDDRTTQDAMHAWAEAHVEGLGWVGFDVSNGISPDTRYVRVATGLDYSDAAPVSGTRVGGAGEVLEVRIDVAQQ